MPHDVIHKMFFPRERLLTDLTPMRSFPGVFPHVVHHVLLPGKRFSTVLTPIRRLSCMAPRVVIQVFLPHETLSANSTTVWLIGRMSFHMALEGRGVCEHMETDGTRKHTTTQVTLAVPAKFLGVCESLTAHLTSERFPFGVVTSMYDELVTELKHFPAKITNVRAHGGTVFAEVARRWLLFVFCYNGEATCILQRVYVV